MVRSRPGVMQIDLSLTLTPTMPDSPSVTIIDMLVALDLMRFVAEYLDSSQNISI